MDSHTHISGGPLDFNHIANGIYIGTNQCCIVGLSEVLQREGITADLSLEGERMDQPFGVEEYIWLPTKDMSPPTQHQLAFGVHALTIFVARGEKVYVHCKNGHGRSTTLVAAYFISRGKSVDEALALIKSGRPTIHTQVSQREALAVFKNSLAHA